MTAAAVVITVQFLMHWDKNCIKLVFKNSFVHSLMLERFIIAVQSDLEILVSFP
jgi:hypothetical protein